MKVSTPDRELRLYIHHENRWRYVYIIRAYKQQDIFGGEEIVFEYKLGKTSNIVYVAEKHRFVKKKPTERQRKVETES